METLIAELAAMTPEERVAKMDNMCHHKKTEEFDKPLTSDEIQANKDIIASNAGKMDSLEEEKKAWLQNWKEEMDPLKDEFTKKVRETRSGTRQVEDTVWMFDDQTSGEMVLVDRDGAIISKRPLRRDERETPTIGLTGTNG